MLAGSHENYGYGDRNKWPGNHKEIPSQALKDVYLELLQATSLSYQYDRLTVTTVTISNCVEN